MKKLLLEKRFSASEIFEKIYRNEQSIKIFFEEKRCAKIFEKLQKLDFAQFTKYIETKNIKIYSILDDDYPEKIRQIHQVPSIIYTQGSVQINEIAIGIVGSRKNTEYGKNVLKKIIDDIPYNNVSIISGGAYGIDSLAHELAIKK